MLKNKLLSIVSLLAIGFTSTAGVFASETFSLTGVKVQDSKTIVAEFSKDLYTEGLNMFEVTLTKIEGNELLSIQELTSDDSKSLTLNLVDELDMEAEYNLVAVFVSDIDGNVIENKVDGEVKFIASDVLVTEEVVPVEEVVVLEEVTPVVEEEAVVSDLTQENVEVVDELNSAEETMVTTTEVASEAEVLPETGPKEVLFVLIALIAGLTILLSRRKA